MNPELSYMIASDVVIEDASTKKITIIGVFDKVLLEAQPVVIIDFAVTARLLNYTGHVAADVKIYEPASMDKVFQSVNLRGENTDPTGLTLIARFNTVSFSKKGDYQIRFFLSIDGKEKELSNLPKMFITVK